MELPNPIRPVTELASRAGSAVAGVGTLAKSGVLSALPDLRALSSDERTQLLALAGRSTTRPWNLEYARNAHATNTPSQMTHALEGNYDVLEGDLRVDTRGRLVMAHDPTQLNGMTFNEWLDITAKSGRGIKVDVKEPEAIATAIRMLRASGIPQARIILNVPIGTGGATSANLGQLQLIRTNMPRATINLSNQRYPYDQTQLKQLAAASDFLGGNVMFPVRADKITPQLTSSLTPYGRVAAWNEPWFGEPTSITAERRRLRQVGVNGTIDLRERPGGATGTIMELRDRADGAIRGVSGWLR